MTRAGILSIHPAPYRDPTFDTIRARGKLDIEVLMMSSEDVGHTEWGLPPPAYPVLPLSKGKFSSKSCRLQPRVLPLLKRGRYDVLLVPGYTRQTALAAIAYAKATNTPFILEADSVHYPHGVTRRSRAADKLVAGILHLASAIRVPGAASRDYMRSYKIPDTRIFEGAYCMDVPGFVRDIEAARSRGAREDWRRKHGIGDGSFVFLHVGNMLASRKHCHAISAVERLPPQKDVCFVLIGSGEERARLEAQAAKLPAGRVRILGPVPFSDLSIAYVASDAYLHPGCEPYSTAMELAAISGIPVVSTRSVGYVNDLVVRDARPMLSEIDDVIALAANMFLIASDRDLASDLGARHARAARQRTPQWAAEQLELAVSTALGRQI